MGRARMIAIASAVCVLAVTVGLAVGCGGESEPEPESESTPKIDSIVPGRGDPGSKMTIGGEMFGEEQGESTVGFGTATADVEEWSDASITITVPQDAKPGDYKISVTTEEGTVEGVDFTVTEPSAPTPSPTSTSTSTPTPTATATPTATPTPTSSPNGVKIVPEDDDVQVQ